MARTNTNVNTGITAITDKSIQGDGSVFNPIELVNDDAAPGNSKYYGTDSGGTKGFFDVAGQADWTATSGPSQIANLYVIQDGSPNGSGTLTATTDKVNWVNLTDGTNDLIALVNFNVLPYDIITLQPSATLINDSVVNYPTTQTVELAGLYNLRIGDTFTISGSANNDGTYTIFSISQSGGNQTIDIGAPLLTTGTGDGSYSALSYAIINVQGTVGSRHIQLLGNASVVRLDGALLEFITVRYDVQSDQYVQVSGKLGIGSTIYPITYADMQSRIGAQTLDVGAFYWITNADVLNTEMGVIVQAINNHEISLQGSSGHQVPRYDLYPIWQPTTNTIDLSKVVLAALSGPFFPSYSLGDAIIGDDGSTGVIIDIIDSLTFRIAIDTSSPSDFSAATQLTDTTVGDTQNVSFINGYIIEQNDTISGSVSGATGRISSIVGQDVIAATINVDNLAGGLSFATGDTIVASNGAYMYISGVVTENNTYNIGDFVTYNGYVYEFINVAGINTQSPLRGGNVVSAVWDPKFWSPGNGWYTEEWDFCEYDIDWNPTYGMLFSQSNGMLTMRHDRRGNTLKQAKAWAGNNFSNQQTPMNVFQWGRNECYSNNIEGYCYNANSLETVSFNNILQGAELDLSFWNDNTATVGGLVHSNTIREEAYVDLYLIENGTFTHNDTARGSAVTAEHLSGDFSYNTSTDCGVDFSMWTGSCRNNTFDDVGVTVTYTYGVPGDSGNNLNGCLMSDFQSFVTFPLLFGYSAASLIGGLSTFTETINPDAFGVIGMTGYEYVGRIHVTDSTYTIKEIAGASTNHNIIVESWQDPGAFGFQGADIILQDASVGGGSNNLYFEGFPTTVTLYNDTLSIGAHVPYRDFMEFKPLVIGGFTIGNYMLAVGGFIRQ